MATTAKENKVAKTLDSRKKAVSRIRDDRRQTPPIDIVPDNMIQVRRPQVPVQPTQLPGQLGAMTRMIEAARTSGPAYTPPAFAPGTPTQRRREADTSAQQFQQQFTYGQERDRVEDEWRQRMFDYQRQQDAVANALRRASATAGGGSSGSGAGYAGTGLEGPGFGETFYGPPGTQTERAQGARMEFMKSIDNAVYSGVPFNQLEYNIKSRAAEMAGYGLDMADMLQHLIDSYNLYIRQQPTNMPPAREAEWLRNKRIYEQEMQRLQDEVNSMKGIKGIGPDLLYGGLQNLD